MYRKIDEKWGKNRFWKFKFNINQNENKNATGEATHQGALRAPLAGSPACVFVFVFVLIYVEFEFSLPPTPSLGSKAWKKNNEKNEV